MCRYAAHLCQNHCGITMNVKARLTAIMHWLGIERNQTSHNEKIISALGACLGIAVTVFVTSLLLSHKQIDVSATVLIISSMGASAVLLFAVPHGVLSQPWPVFGGHLISAFIGISCAQLLPAGFITAGIAVGLAVGAMYYLRCIHPPGGASALTAVVGGSQIHEMGYQFMVYPILLNLIAILLVAFLFNYLFAWRRYPAHFNTRHITDTPVTSPISDYVLTTEDFNAAIHELDSFVDITEEGLTELLERAKLYAQTHIKHPGKIVTGRCYSNGNIGKLWSVRHVIDDAGQSHAGKDLIIYKTVAGQGAYDTGYCDRETFRDWARFEVIEENGLWIKHSRDS